MRETINDSPANSIDHQQTNEHETDIKFNSENIPNLPNVIINSNDQSFKL